MKCHGENVIRAAMRLDGVRDSSRLDVIVEVEGVVCVESQSSPVNGWSSVRRGRHGCMKQAVLTLTTGSVGGLHDKQG